MDEALFRVRPLRAADIDAAVALAALANPAHDARSLAGTRQWFELSVADIRDASARDEALRATAAVLAESNQEVLLRAWRAHPENDAVSAAKRLITYVAEEVATGRVVGMISVGPPAKWAHHAMANLPPHLVDQLRDRVAEVLEIAVHPSVRRQGIGRALMQAALNPRSARASRWRVAIWFFHEGEEAGGFHRSLAEQWPVGQAIEFMDSAGRAEPFRVLEGDLRACVAPLNNSVRLNRDLTGRVAIEGVFDSSWPAALTGPGAAYGPVPVQRAAQGRRSAQKPSKADRKREKKARGRARG
ncbi:GNAT family N-acetyltransferase [Streptomyces albidoflavus]|uniref:GNAT family N-acetyltransferase n=1 Tax=Streptomyces sp. B29(2018) TaxID=2485016 RepID=UPI000FD65BE3|nr:GNAT family N-acetyltransferase [Streptomyces sp. B29(2018)]